MMIMIITPKRWRDDGDDDGGHYDDTWEGGRSGERELGSSLRSLQSDIFLEKLLDCLTMVGRRKKERAPVKRGLWSAGGCCEEQRARRSPALSTSGGFRHLCQNDFAIHF